MQASLTQADEKSECARGTRPSRFPPPGPEGRAGNISARCGKAVPQQHRLMERQDLYRGRFPSHAKFAVSNHVFPAGHGRPQAHPDPSPPRP